MNARKIKIPVLLAALAVLIPHNAPCEADGPDHWQVHGVAADDVLNIRQEPDRHSAKIGEVPPDGSCLKNLKCVGGLTFEEFTRLSQEEKDNIEKARPRWCLIEYKGTRGWVAGRYLREGACAPGSP